ncbi:MAG: phosphoenolpyruvate--protein phosphotransferase [Ruminococcaceae bacterium]|nr:phosphoenolpyruvate--protein phosphotransferase [Oscillospiraceae bacterium]
MQSFCGKGVSGDIAIGRIAVFKKKREPVTRRRIEDTAAELARFEAARVQAESELAAIYQKALREVGEAGAQIFAIHRMMLSDEDFCESITGMIANQSINAEYAAALTADNFAAMMSSMEDSYMQARAADVQDIAARLIRCLSGESEGNELCGRCILCADDLAPSETVMLDKNRVLAFVTAHGSKNSHTAILARSMNIPAVIGMGDAFLKTVRDGDMAIVNGGSGEVILSPDEAALGEARRQCEENARRRQLLEELRGKENVTLDGHRIDIFANIGGIDNIGEVLLGDAGGIGLFRSEFLYLERSDFPSEEEQFSVYRRVLESMAGRRVIIRTLDIGADKKADYFDLEAEENPALGMRAIRICLTRPDIFRTQLRALYRASAFGNLGIMFPMIISEREVMLIRGICEEVRDELAAAGIPMAERIEHGIMIETPAAAIISDKLAPLVDFFSVGTNDLTQYTLACDRQNPALDGFVEPHHEALMRLIEFAAENIHRRGGWIGICGELAADAALTERFLRMGIDELSVSPSYVLPLREVVRGLDLSK